LAKECATYHASGRLGQMPTVAGCSATGGSFPLTWSQYGTQGVQGLRCLNFTNGTNSATGGTITVQSDGAIACVLS
jgi:hypothetical protein